MTQEPRQRPPGTEAAMAREPDRGEDSYLRRGQLHLGARIEVARGKPVL